MAGIVATAARTVKGGRGGGGLTLGFHRLWGRPRPVALSVVVGVVYVAIFIVVMNRHDRRRKARDEEADERAAVERGESGFPSGDARL